MKSKRVIVEDYNPLWSDAFLSIKKDLESVLKDDVLAIEHVGSTSVPGLKAKPIIDIDIIIDDQSQFQMIKDKLRTIGYIHEGDQGIEGREAFGYQNKAHLMRHHLYVCHKDNFHLKRHLALRDHLRKHPKDVEAYGLLKEELSKKYPNDINQYIEGKSDLILSIYKIYGLEKEND